MEYREFAKRIAQVLKSELNEVSREERERIYFGSEFTYASLPLRTMYREYISEEHMSKLQSRVYLV